MSGGEESLSLDEKVLRYCALFPKNHTIRRKELIEYLIDEEIIDENDSRRAEFQSGHDILNILVTCRLVERCEDHEGLQYVKMRDEIRDEAIKRSRRTQLVEAGRRLEAIPNVEKWTSDLLRVSLMHNDILNVPPSHREIACSHLSTLLLGNNLNLERIADGFLGKFKKLKVLDLSMTNIQTLPKDVGSLKNLTALLLCGCGQLSRVPCLRNLESLKKLDLKRTGLENMPGGVELLSSLKYLDISNNEIKEIPSETLSKLSCLQVLKLNELETARPITVVGEEVGSLRKLETLRCNFKNLSDFSTYWNHQERSKELLSEYLFLIGEVNWPDEFGTYDTHHFSQSTKTVGMFNCCEKSKKEKVYLPTDVQMLLLEKCHDIEDLSDLPALKSATELSGLFLIECEEIVGLIPSSWFSEGSLRSLQYLKLAALGKLTDLVVRRSDSSSPTTSLRTDSTFSQLTRIEVVSCDVMKKLLPRSLVPCLKNLEAITVEYCDIMEEIFATDEEGSQVSRRRSNCQSRHLNLPKLKTLVLKRLPELTSICKEVLRCPLVEIEVVECGQIKSFHIEASTTDPWIYQSSLGVIEASYPRESREPMECGDSNY